MTYCGVTKVLERPGPLPPTNAAVLDYEPLPPPERVPCETRGGDVHLCLGPPLHDGWHLCSCGWAWR